MFDEINNKNIWSQIYIFGKDFYFMDKYGPLINAANRAIDNAKTLLGNDNTPFNAMYKQFKTLQSLWLRMVEESADGKNRRLESICIDLELAMVECEQYLKKSSPKKEDDSKEGKEKNKEEETKEVEEKEKEE